MDAARPVDETPELDDDDPLTAKLREALRLNAVAHFVESRSCLDDALAQVSLDDGWRGRYWTARLLITRAYPTMELVGQEEALAELRTARQIGRSLGSARLVALSHIQESNVHFRATRWRDAVRAATAAETASGGAALNGLSQEETYALLLNRGFSLLELRRLDEADRDLHRAHEVALAIGSNVLLFKAIHNLGCLEWVRGNLPAALDLMGRADAVPADIPRDRAWLDQAQVLIEAGLLDRARSRLRDALATARQEGHRLDEGAIHLDLARCAIHDGHLDTAREQARRAIEQFTAGGATHRVHRAELTLATVDLASGVDPGRVEATARTWLAVAGDPAEDRAATRLLAEALLARGAADECATLLEGTRPTSGFGAADELHEYLVRVQLAHAHGRTRDTVSLCRAAARRLATYQLQAQSLELRAAAALHGGRLAAFDIESAVASGSASRVFASVERWRSASHRLSPLGPPEDPVAARLLTTLRHTRHAAAESGADVRAEIHRLEDAVTRRELSRPHHLVDTTVTPPVSVARTRDAAGATGATVTQLCVTGGVVRAVVVTGRRCTLHVLGRAADIAPLLRRLGDDLRARALAGQSGPLSAAVAAALADSLREVDDALGRPLARLVPRAEGPVVLVPTGALPSVPWSLLPSWRGVPVLLTPSVSRWVRFLDPGSAEPPEVASPSELASPSEVASPPTGRPEREPRARVRALAGPGLPHAAAEARSVASIWGASAEYDELATTAAVRRALARTEVVHIAAHGAHEDQNPLFASLRLADGPLFIHEFPANPASRHVVLSACDVGRSKVQAGDEPLGFAAALLARGIPSVVAAIAPVPDEAAASAMASYHRELAAGTAASSALARAVEEVPDAGAFCLFGADWSATHGP